MRFDVACKLYGILGKYLPEPLEGETVQMFTARVFNLLVGHPKDLLDSLMLLTGLEAEQLAKMDADELWKWWMEGMAESKILLMKEFLEGLNNG